MKKFILTVALVLAVVTSLVAGTMAAYTQKLDTTSANITAKTFSIKGTMSDSFSHSFKLAPGESIDYTVEVKNEGEVASKLAMTADILAANGDDIDGLKLTIVSVDKIGSDTTADKSAKLSTTNNADGVLKAGETAKVTFRLTWEYATDDAANARDNADMSKAVSLFKISVNAVGVAGTATQQ